MDPKAIIFQRADSVSRNQDCRVYSQCLDCNKIWKRQVHGTFMQMTLQNRSHPCVDMDISRQICSVPQSQSQLASLSICPFPRRTGAPAFHNKAVFYPKCFLLSSYHHSLFNHCNVHQSATHLTPQSRALSGTPPMA